MDTLWLIDTIIDESGFPGVGLPIGTLTSQLFANIYLDAFDHRHSILILLIGIICVIWMTL